jgi:hypothetical protein
MNRKKSEDELADEFFPQRFHLQELKLDSGKMFIMSYSEVQHYMWYALQDPEVTKIIIEPIKEEK